MATAQQVPAQLAALAGENEAKVGSNNTTVLHRRGAAEERRVIGRRKHKKSTTRTERMVRLCDGTALALTVLVVVLAFMGRDNTYVEILAGAWIAEAAHFHKLYAQKEGRANSQKYMEAWVNQTAEKYGPDQAARFAELVLTTNTTQ